MNQFQIGLQGNEATFTCASDDTLLRAALRAGIALPYECNSGGCGSCKFELVTGNVDNQWPDAPALTPRDHRKGKLLACQCRPTEDCSIKIGAGTSDMPRFRPQRFTARLTEIVILTSDMSEFRFTADAPAEFQPGQYVLFDIPGVSGARGYSMSNLANSNGDWHFIVKRKPDGKATHFLFSQLELGSSIDMDGPYGLAFLRNNVPRDTVCIAGGSGLSPMMSIVRAQCSDATNSERTIHVFYGGRGPDDICTPGLMAELDNAGSELFAYDAISDEEQKHRWDGECCFIHELVEKKLGPKLSDYEFYFCGPPPMTDACQRMLMIDHKVPFEQIHFDRFF
jgi:toluene monooxygenase electron transfer component